MDMFHALAAPFPPEAISWRVGTSNKKKIQRETSNQQAKATKGQVLAYIDARDVMERLDSVCGPAHWQDRYEFHGSRTICYLSIRVGEEWVTKADGAGDSDVEAEKGAISDALKRAAVKWGIGRYIYNLPTPWVDLDEWEHITPASLENLRGILRRSAPASSAIPSPSPGTVASSAGAKVKSTLAERAAALHDALKSAATDQVKLKRTFELGAGLCADLDAKDPERLAEIVALYERLQENPAEVFA